MSVTRTPKTVTNNPAIPYNSAFVTWTVDTAIYADKDQFGDIEEFASILTAVDGTMTIESITLIDDDKLSPDLDVLIFDSEPTLTSSDNGALAMSVANLQKCRVRVEVRACNWSDLSGQTIAQVKVGEPIKGINGDASLFVVIQNRTNAGVTPIATDSISLSISAMRD